jgi:hypothetical protein
LFWAIKLPKYYVIVYLLFLLTKARWAKTKPMEMKISQPIFGILVVLTKNELMKIYIEPVNRVSFSFRLDYEDACSQKVEDKSIIYFQIKNANGDVLELNHNSDSELPMTDIRSTMELPDSRAGKTFQFSPNEYKDSQFWYWHQQPNSDYGYIGSKLDVSKFLSIAFSNDMKGNGKFTKMIEHHYIHLY